MPFVNFRAFRAIDEPESCARFIEGHRHVLEIFDIKMITSNKDLWTTHENTYVIIAESAEDGKVLGGARIQIADNQLPLPIEDAVGIVDKKIYDVVQEHKKGRTGEICGLWNSREIAGFGLGSIYLGWSGVVLAQMLELNTLFALCAPATVRNCKQVGFTVERSLGSNGYFNYPKLNLVATAMIIQDVKALSSATENVRETVHSLAENPSQTITFDSPKGAIHIHYDLNFKRHPA